MNDISSAELERQAEQKREEIARTAESLKQKLTPGQLVDELTGYFKGSDGSTMLHNLKGQVRDNPLALTMIGAGVAWLITRHPEAGHPESGHPEEREAYRSGFGSDGDSVYPAPETLSGVEVGNDLSDATGDGRVTSEGIGGRAADTVSEAASRVGSSARQARSAVAEGVGAVSGQARRARAGISRETGAWAEASRSLFLDTLHREPLVIGALGLAVGAAIGAMLPSTRVEDEYLGPERDDLKREAERRMRDGLEEAKHVVDDAYAAGKEEARKQGLTQDGGKPLAQKAASVTKTAADAAQKSAETRLGEHKAS